MSISLTDIINKLDNSSFEKYYINFNKKVSDYDDIIEIIFDNRNSIYSSFLNIQETNNHISRTDDISLFIEYQLYPITTNFTKSPDNFIFYSEIKIPFIGIFRIYYHKNLLELLNSDKKIILLDVQLFDAKEIGGHANLLVLDFNDNTMFRYEPHGNSIRDPLEQLFRFNISKFISNKTNKIFKYADSKVCNLSGLQALESKCNISDNTWEYGYCLSWTTLYQYIMLKHNLPSHLYEQYIMTLISLKTSKTSNDIEISCLLRDLIKIFNLYMNDYPKKALVDAIKKRDVEKAKRIVRFTKTNVSNQALEIAIEDNNIDLLKFLLEIGIKPTGRDIYNIIKRYTHKTRQFENNYQMLTMLIENDNIDLNKYENGTSLIELASSLRYWDAVKLLIGHKVDVNKYVEHSPLYYALVNKNSEIAMLLLDNGAIINYDLLKLSIWMDTESFSKILNNNNSLIKIEPEILFIVDRDWDKFGLLLDKINNVNIIDWIGQTPLLMALRDKWGPSLKILINLIEKDDNLNYFSNPKWLQYAILRYEQLNNIKAPNLTTTPLSAALQNRPEVIPYMIKYEANINYKNIHGNTLLHEYVHDPDKVKLLLLNGSDKTIKNEVGETAFDIAIKKKYDRSISLLIENQIGGYNCNCNYNYNYNKYKNKYIKLKIIDNII